MELLNSHKRKQKKLVSRGYNPAEILEDKHVNITDSRLVRNHLTKLQLAERLFKIKVYADQKRNQSNLNQPKITYLGLKYITKMTRQRTTHTTQCTSINGCIPICSDWH